ncbi:indole-3-glycerol phosphate synthase TrpC [Telmatocola sphagniphila]|uniref:Indole-3-glycerol phosphate synthase n=1 Tax=Telmatocola sphagniphila TaxID=1123043 RepID=A0A8E6B7K8_9BACT|nr:indole-3-glycerol phosphate synthase TrpC [Telmatocola sphagniphila]QVL33343.1 indole-3-glycerol phosphate synthase TrpC [Telmatocola sphagniphila]
MGTILDQIVQTKRIEIERAKSLLPQKVLEDHLVPPIRSKSFLKALSEPGIRIIAEVKKASPSAGVIRADFDPVQIAKIYARHRADCISVLTDKEYFQGDLDYLKAIRKEVKIPLLRKEFIIDTYQILEARFAGADAVLLIAECLPGSQMKDLYDFATQQGLDTLIEFHDVDQLNRVVDTGCPLIGINNRDLRSFETRLETTLSLIPKIPHDRLVVSESGIRTSADLRLLENAGAKAVLVGESLMRSPDIGEALDQLLGLPKTNHFTGAP